MGRKYLGSHLCIMTRDAQANKSNNGVVIIAHGVQPFLGKKFTLPGGAVYFYCPDGDSLKANAYSFLKKWAGNRVYDSVSSSGSTKCPDYELAKAISYHTSDAARKLGKQGIDDLVKTDPDEAESKNRANYDALESLVTSGQTPFDIVSIRNRWYSGGTTLSDVIGKLLQEGYGYGEYHCCFCRAGSDPKAYDLGAGKYA